MIRYVLEREGDVAAVVAEPIRAVPMLPPPGFWTEVRRACDDHGALLIFDEIATGLGRTGQFYTHAHTGAVPDMVVLGKALGGGMLPVAALLARPGLDVAADKALGHYTHEKNPVLAAAALATLAVIEQEGLVERAARLGAEALERLSAIAARHGADRHEARGIGLLLGLDLSDEKGDPDREAADAALYAALERGLSFKVSMGSVLTLAPPLTIAEDDLQRALDILDSVLGG
jgi:4-aminobutyrate aminotransferase